MPATVRVSVAAAVLLSLISDYACAHLGGDTSSVGVDRVALASTQSTTARQLYDVHELTTSGGTVREYATRDGQVFAVTWQGIRPPNLRQIFGDDYYARYQAAAVAARQSQGGIRRELAVRQSDFVAHSFGHMRAFRGAAYIPALVPAGFSTSSELQ